MIDPKEMSCEEFQAQMAEIIGSGADAASHPHVQNCDLCRALLQDLQAIADAAKLLFPVIDPPDDLWVRIEDKLKEESPQNL